MAILDNEAGLFSQASEKLYEGAFDEALRLYATSMHDEDVYGSMKGYCAMGITFYLKGDIPMAIKCYTVCSRFAVLQFPELLQDYQAMLKGDAEAKERLLTRCFYLAGDWGWSASRARMAEKNESPDDDHERLYRDLVMGRRGEDSLSQDEKLQYGQRMLECRKIGYDFMFDDFQKMIEDRESTTAEMKAWIAEIFEVVKKLVIAAHTSDSDDEAKAPAP